MSFQTQDEQSNEPTQISSDKLTQLRTIIENHFNEEINYKKLELETIDDVIKKKLLNLINILNFVT